MTSALIYGCVLSVIVVVPSYILADLNRDIVPKLFIKYDQERLPIFYGNVTDYFKLLDKDDFSILIGARNNVYNVSLTNLIENRKQRIEWISSDAHRELCALKGKHETDCQNYIRVYGHVSDNQIMICGTNSYKPLCRYYNKHDEEDSSRPQLELANEIEAQGRCPYNPTHNSTYVYTDGQLYSATVADFSGADPLIYRETQRTEQYDLKQLNQPAFVSAVERNGYVLFFFREVAMEYQNCGKKIYSRVGRVCKNDKGGPYKFSDRWTSFLKTRLNCSIPGEYPFYFDEIQSTSKIIEGLYQSGSSYAQSIIYIVFSTSPNAIPGSAICAFYVDDIMEAFEGRFLFQRDAQSTWLPIPNEAVPEPRPGKCVDDSRTLPTMSMNFIKTHTLMESAVPSMHNQPLLTRTIDRHRFTAITVDPQIEALDGQMYDVLFVGTDDGRVIKLVHIMSNDSDAGDNSSRRRPEPIIVTESQALPVGHPVRELSVARHTESLIVIGDGHVVSVPLHHCTKITHCRDCLKLQDPYCAWDIRNHECAAATMGQRNIYANPEHFIQRLSNVAGVSDLCHKYGETGNWIDPPPIVIHSTRGTLASVGRASPIGYDNEITVTSIDGVELTNQINKIHTDPLVKESLGGHAAGVRSDSLDDNLQLGLSPALYIAMAFLFIVGIATGFLYTKLRNKFAPCYNDHRNQINAYSQKRHIQPLHSGKDINLLMEANSFQCNNKKDNLEQEFSAKDRSHECKNSTENLEKDTHCKTGTLQKVKKTYL